MKNEDGEFDSHGWVKLAYRFSTETLDDIATLKPHLGRGQRLTDMQALQRKLPASFKAELESYGFLPIPNRAVGFIKTKDKNWSLPWHQDRVIAMPSKQNLAAYSNWSRKSGIWHCEPLVQVLRNMAFAYIAFDDMPHGRGGLELAEGTHLDGIIENIEIDDIVKNKTITKPNLMRGDVLLISALTLHRSATLSGSDVRRALRLDFERRNHDYT